MSKEVSVIMSLAFMESFFSEIYHQSYFNEDNTYKILKHRSTADIRDKIVKIACKMNHKNVIKTSSANRKASEITSNHVDNTIYTISMTYFPSSTLKHYLRRDVGLEVEWSVKEKIAADILSGLSYIHQHSKQPLIHNGIRAENILVNAQGDVKIAGFSQFGLLTPQNSPSHHAPEFYSRQVTPQLGERCDVWSYGITLYEMCLDGESPWRSRGHSEGLLCAAQIINALVNKWLPYDEEFQCGSENIQTIIDKCLEWDIDNRPTCEVLQNIH